MNEQPSNKFVQFEAHAVAIKERATQLLHDQVTTAAVAVEGGATQWLAHLWGTSTARINTLAKMFAAFPLEMITPDLPTCPGTANSIFSAALDTDDPVTWLKRAIAEGWSSRQLRDAADVAKGRRESRVLWINSECRDVVLAKSHATGETRVSFTPAVTPSGEAPSLLRVRAVEVLDG